MSDDGDVGGGIARDAAEMESDSSSAPRVAATEIDSDSSSAPRVIDLISSSDESESAGALDPIAFWRARIDRFSRVLDETNADSRTAWLLPAPGHDQHAHAVACVRENLALGYVQGFKIGITHIPQTRFGRLDYQTFTSFTILSVNDDSQKIADLEISVLAVFRRYDVRGFLVNPAGHALCENRQPGGENAHHGCAPFCLYLALRRP